MESQTLEEPRLKFQLDLLREERRFLMTDERSGNCCRGTAERQLGGAAVCSVQLSLSLPCVIPQHPDLPETSPVVKGLSLELLPGLTGETRPCSPEHTEP